ncbi:uncharacterized protein BJ171DRAFT_499613 [Polychytrium aggregatum]|uniref:uncharacterized protein n=1 Tax=Polychytrium aggregatum TaxID=110093 RepID=UPI0022FE70B1|nr:uncharacterized protein BJ171DRAFT_499613 [Polychytrium aggregatum]KAI9205792.1 hypothetical protein BJ171DRAFT_499613 [Polychytrium aggregatum]
MRHLSTREELERHVEGRLKLALSKLKLPAQSTINTLLKRLESKISRVRADVMKHTDRLGAQLSASAGSGSPISQTRELIEDMVKDHTIDIRHELESRFNQLKREILTDHAPDEPLHARQKGGRVKKSPLRSEIREYINRKMDDELHRVEDELAEMRRLVQDLEPRQESDGSEALPVRDTESSRDELEAVDTAVKGLRREFDEKLYMICSDLSSCKLAYQQSLQEPFHKCARWLWKSGALKYGSAVPWNYETLNTDPDNFRWEQDQINIRIAQPGLYEIAFAFFTKAKPSIQLVVNGESVLSAINSASYVVHHSSGFITTGDGKVQEGTVAGLSLLDFLALPSKSTISLHYHGGKKNSLGHGFLSLRQLF